MNDKIAIPKTITDLCEARNKAIIAYTEGLKYIEQAAKICEESGEYLKPYKARAEIDIERYINDLDQNLWRHAFNKIGLLQFMDAQAKKEFEKGLEVQPPKFTIENIESTFFTAAMDVDNMFARGLVNVFLRLSDRHKTNTNSPFKINPKAILGGMCKKGWSQSQTIHISYYERASEQINDIDRVIKTLDNKKHQARELECNINEAFKTGSKYEDAYYKITGYLNGNMHIVFKRQDLLDKANLIIAKYYDGNTLAA